MRSVAVGLAIALCMSTSLSVYAQTPSVPEQPKTTNPAIVNIDPSMALVGASFVLTIHDENFIENDDIVYWNDVPLTTHYVSPEILTANTPDTKSSENVNITVNRKNTKIASNTVPLLVTDAMRTDTKNVESILKISNSSKVPVDVAKTAVKTYQASLPNKLGESERSEAIRIFGVNDPKAPVLFLTKEEQSNTAFTYDWGTVGYGLNWVGSRPTLGMLYLNMFNRGKHALIYNVSDDKTVDLTKIPDYKYISYRVHRNKYLELPSHIQNFEDIKDNLSFVFGVSVNKFGSKNEDATTGTYFVGGGYMAGPMNIVAGLSIYPNNGKNSTALSFGVTTDLDTLGMLFKY